MIPGVNAAIGGGGGAFDAGYQMPGGVWLDGAADYFSWTPASAGDRQKYTIEICFRRLGLGTSQALISSGSSTTVVEYAYLDSDDKLRLYAFEPSDVFSLITARVFRDVGAFYQIVISVDTTQATASDRIKLFVNGVQETDFDTESYPSQNKNLQFTNNTLHEIGRRVHWNDDYFKATYSRCALIDGTAYVASDFGESDANGTWRPKNISGLTFGTNGFWLDFADSADLGDDNSGNGNDWTLNSITSDNATADVSSDPLATFNPLAARHSTQTLSEGNMRLAQSGSGGTPLTIGLRSGLWYYEIDCTTAVSSYVGMTREDSFGTSYTSGAETFGKNTGGDVFKNNTHQTENSISHTSSDVLMVAIDMDNHLIWWGKNGTWYSADSGTATTITAGDIEAGNNGYDFSSLDDGNFWHPWVASSGGSDNLTLLIHEDDWNYSAPTDFKSIKASNLPEPAIKKGSDHFLPLLYTGDGSTSDRSITGVDFQGDLAWFKDRGAAENHVLIDSLRPGFPSLFSNATNAEIDEDEFTSFDSDGITIKRNATYGRLNDSSSSMIVNLWKGGGSGVSNTDGSITSTVSVNSDAGFSVVTYTSPNNASDQTVGHGLASAPDVIIVKDRDSSFNWDIYHSALGFNSSLIFTTAATRSGAFGAEPSSTVFTTKNGFTHSGTDDYVAYCFRSVPGFSKFGSYTGNASADGPFVWCGFKVRWLMVKRTDSSSDWVLYDAEREPFNPVGQEIQPDKDSAELASGEDFDLLSNGFKPRRSATNFNASGGTCIFAAFAEHPFGGENTTPILAV